MRLIDKDKLLSDVTDRYDSRILSAEYNGDGYKAYAISSNKSAVLNAVSEAPTVMTCVTQPRSGWDDMSLPSETSTILFKKTFSDAPFVGFYSASTKEFYSRISEVIESKYIEKYMIIPNNLFQK